jgi:hypothetical protein
MGTAATPGGAIATGVGKVTISPGTQAAAASARWVAGVNAAQTKWATRVGAVTLNEWQTAMTTKGLSRVGPGAQAAAGAGGKFQAFMTALLTFEQNAIGTLNGTYPKDGTLATGINRATWWINHMATFRTTNPNF